MDIATKIIVFTAVLIGDVIGAIMVSRKLSEQGRTEMIRIIVPALLLGLVGVGVVLFVVI
jgi:hypothetical protein